MKRIKKSPKIVLIIVSFNLGVTINITVNIVVKNIIKRSLDTNFCLEIFSVSDSLVSIFGLGSSSDNSFLVIDYLILEVL